MPHFSDNLFIPFGTGFDPWVGTVKQTNRLKAYCRVWVAGVEITNKLNPHLISAKIIDKGPASQAELEIDDRDGTLPLPPLAGLIRIMLGWVSEMSFKDFTGRIQDLEYGVERGTGGGRRMWVHANSADYTNSNVQAPMDDNTGEGAPPGQQTGTRLPLRGFLEQLGKGAGTAVQVHPKIGAIMRDFWGASGESLMHYGQRMMEQLGGTFQITDDNVAQFSAPGEKVDGSPRNIVVARWGDNLIGCRVRPLLGRVAWGGMNQSHWDSQAANWIQKLTSMGLPNPWGQSKAAFTLPRPAASSEDGSQDGQGAGAQAASALPGRIAMNGEPAAEFQGTCLLVGVRPGVDGAYRIDSAEHSYARDSGYVTWLDVFVITTAATSTNVGTGITANPQDGRWEPALPQQQDIHSGITFPE